MKRQKENYRSRKSRKRALRLRQFGTHHDRETPAVDVGMPSITNPFVAAVTRMLKSARGE